MKASIVWPLLILTTFFWNNTDADMTEPPLNTTIKILVVRDSSVTPAEAETRIDFLEQTWNGTLLNTPVPTPNPISITFVNDRESILYYPGNLTGEADFQILKLKIFSYQPFNLVDVTPKSIRDHYEADIILGLTNHITPTPPLTLVCGFADQQNWLSGPMVFNEDGDGNDGDGLDRNGALTSFAAIIAVNSSCRKFMMAHEFGHLLGGGHEDTGGLNPDSRGWGGPLFRMFEQDFKEVTVLASLLPEFCTDYDIPANRCLRFKSYSDSIEGDSGHRNANTLFQTAESVANYLRTDDGPAVPVAMCGDGIDNDGDSLVDAADPNCAQCGEEYCPVPPPPPPPSCAAGAIAPHGLTAEIVQSCVPGTSTTLWDVRWDHACPLDVDYYNVWFSFPIGGFPYIETRTTIRSQPVYIWGPPNHGEVRIQACGAGGCSISGPVVVSDIC